MEQRMTLCNLTIEGGGRAGMIAPDDTTFAYIDGRAVRAAPATAGTRRLRRGATCAATTGAAYDRVVTIDAATLEPTVTWGTTPAQSVPVTGRVPDPESFDDAAERESAVRALAYMGLEPGTRDRGHHAGHRLHRLVHQRPHRGPARRGRDARRPARPRRSSRARGAGIRAGEGCRRKREGLDAIFTSAGAEWRNPGCSMCLGMNPDILQPGERCASTSNRNFEGRQGRGGRTHLVSPVMAAAAAVEGRFVDVRRMAVPAGARA